MNTAMNLAVSLVQPLNKAAFEDWLNQNPVMREMPFMEAAVTIFNSAYRAGQASCRQRLRVVK